MPKLQKIFTLEISPEQFLNNCSPSELKEIDLLIQSNHYVKRMESQTCSVCGCSDYDCRDCMQKTGKPCYWIEPNLCSACAGTIKEIENES
ncbi:hypothetical protein ABXT08_07105 [Chryseobacterium sp. NRRL B-14859]|uniref:hypothetical protein n=1 Tax=Chryseobacterium sp. NRRL B-14859 TaxID=1562763 RepID=UPI0033973DF6